MIGSRLSRVALLVVGAPWLTSCSLLFVQTPPARPPKTGPIECTSSVAAPAIDALIAGLQVVRVAYALSQDDGDYDDFPISRGADVGLGMGFVALFGGSSAYGFNHTSECKKLERRRNEALPAVDMGCRRDDQCKGDRICEAGSCVRPGPVAPSASPASEARRVPSSDGPVGAFGNRFGATLDSVRGACTAGGGVLTASGTDLFECRRTAPSRSDAPIVSMRFCADTLCEVDALYPIVPTTLHEWMQRYDRMEGSLKRQLGPPAEQHRSMTSSCTTDYPTCFSAESPDFSVVWRWPNGRQVWFRSTPEGMVRLTFTGARVTATESQLSPGGAAGTAP